MWISKTSFVHTFWGKVWWGGRKFHILASTGKYVTKVDPTCYDEKELKFHIFFKFYKFNYHFPI